MRSVPWASVPAAQGCWGSGEALLSLGAGTCSQELCVHGAGCHTEGLSAQPFLCAFTGGVRDGADGFPAKATVHQSAVSAPRTGPGLPAAELRRNTSPHVRAPPPPSRDVLGSWCSVVASNCSPWINAGVGERTEKSDQFFIFSILFL